MAALVGFCGVIAGVLIGGVVTAYLNHRQHLLESMVAARVLSATLRQASDKVGAVLSSGDLGMADDWTHLMNAWESNRQSLARVVSTDNWDLVTAAFSFVSIAIGQRRALAEEPNGGVVIGSPKEINATFVLKTCQAAIEAAYPALKEASKTRKERWAAENDFRV